MCIAHVTSFFVKCREYVIHEPIFSSLRSFWFRVARHLYVYIYWRFSATSFARHCSDRARRFFVCTQCKHEYSDTNGEQNYSVWRLPFGIATSECRCRWGSESGPTHYKIICNHDFVKHSWMDKEPIWRDWALSDQTFIAFASRALRRMESWIVMLDGRCAAIESKYYILMSETMQSWSFRDKIVSLSECLARFSNVDNIANAVFIRLQQIVYSFIDLTLTAQN